jgi:hypothetical protein
VFVVHVQNRYRDQRRKDTLLENMRKDNSNLTVDQARGDPTFLQVDNLARAEAMGARRSRERTKKLPARMGSSFRQVIATRVTGSLPSFSIPMQTTS